MKVTVISLSGQIGFLVCGESERDLRTPVRRLETDSPLLTQLRFYNSDLHQASFTLPNFARRKIYPTE